MGDGLDLASLAETSDQLELFAELVESDPASPAPTPRRSRGAADPLHLMYPRDLVGRGGKGNSPVRVHAARLSAFAPWPATDYGFLAFVAVFEGSAGFGLSFRTFFSESLIWHGQGLFSDDGAESATLLLLVFLQLGFQGV